MPNASFKVEKDQLAEFADTLTSIKTAQDYSKLKDDFSIRRTDPEFWSFADELHTWYIPVIIQDACCSSASMMGLKKIYVALFI